MFLAIREITTARGRFALIGGTVALITLLLVMLSGLTEGLSKQNTPALEAVVRHRGRLRGGRGTRWMTPSPARV